MAPKTVTESGFYNGRFLKPGASYDAADDAPVDLERMSKDALIAEAAKRGVEIKSTDTKAEILSAIEAKA